MIQPSELSVLIKLLIQKEVITKEELKAMRIEVAKEINKID